MKEFLTIIIPVYKVSEEYLCKCLDSICGQTRLEFRVILVDDGSPDRCGAICDKYAQTNHRISVIHQANRGVSAARNTALKFVKTEFVTFVDADDWVEPDFVFELYKAVCQGKADIYFFDYFEERASESSAVSLMEDRGQIKGPWVEEIRCAPFHCLVHNGAPSSYYINPNWNKMYRTSLIRDNGIRFPEDAKKGEDAVFNAIAFQLTERYSYLRLPLYHYRHLDESASNCYNPATRMNNEILYGYLKQVLGEFGLTGIYQKAYAARVATSFYSYMRLYLFHPKSGKSFRESKEELKEMMELPLYQEALEAAAYSQMTRQQKIFVACLKRRWFGVLWCLVRLRDKYK